MRESDLAALAHQDLPFERLVDDLAPDRSLARNPLFQVMLVFQNAPRQDWQLPGVECPPPGRAPAGPVRPDVLPMREQRRAEGRPAGLRGQLWRMPADLFDASDGGADRGPAGPGAGAVAADPAVRISQVELLEAAERRAAARAVERHGRPVPA